MLDLEARKTLKVIQVSEYSQRISLSADDKYAFTSDQRSPRLAVINTEHERGRALGEAARFGLRHGRDERRQVAGRRDAHSATRSRSSISRRSPWRVPSTCPQAPQEVLIRPDNEIAYVSCDVMRQGCRDQHRRLDDCSQPSTRVKAPTAWPGRRVRRSRGLGRASRTRQRHRENRSQRLRERLPQRH